MVVVNLTKHIAQKYRIVASSGVVLTGSTIPLRAIGSARVMNKKPFSVWRDQRAPESDLERTRACDVHSTEEIKWVTRKNLETPTRIATRIQELHQGKHPNLRLTQDVRVHRRALDTIDIDTLEGFPAEWVDTRVFRRAPRSGANIVGPTSCYHSGGEFVICAPETADAGRPIRNLLTPKAPPTPPPGAWKFEPHPAAASSGGQAGAAGVSPAVSVPSTKDPTEADKFDRELRQLITKHSAGKRDKASEAHVLGLQTCLKLLRTVGRECWNLREVHGFCLLTTRENLPHVRCPRLIPEVGVQDDWWNRGLASRVEHKCLISVLQHTAMSQKSPWLHDHLHAEQSQNPKEKWMSEAGRQENANDVIRKFSRDRCDRHDSGRPCTEMFEKAVPFPEDPTWSMIFWKGIDNESRYPKASDADESLVALEADWKEAARGTTPWRLALHPPGHHRGVAGGRNGLLDNPRNGRSLLLPVQAQ